MRTYYLCAFEQDKPSYSIEEIFQESKKHKSLLFEADSIEKFDRQTALFTSFSDMIEEFNEIYGQNLVLYHPFIISDVESKSTTRSSLIIDIVYASDFAAIKDYDSIKLSTLECLLKDTSAIREFPGINKIFKNSYSNEKLDGRLIRLLVTAYFNSSNYKKYRDAYFSLKRLGYYDEKDYHNARHK